MKPTRRTQPMKKGPGRAPTRALAAAMKGAKLGDPAPRRSAPSGSRRTGPANLTPKPATPPAGQTGGSRFVPMPRITGDGSGPKRGPAPGAKPGNLEGDQITRVIEKRVKGGLRGKLRGNAKTGGTRAPVASINRPKGKRPAALRTGLKQWEVNRTGNERDGQKFRREIDGKGREWHVYADGRRVLDKSPGGQRKLS